MIINHNISAMNSTRIFANNVKAMESNIAHLSSGERINKGGDDAAGLAVSEKMRAQIRGLNQASRNIQDAASLVQTTEGHLKESNDVLHRMRELSVQAANGTYTREDRAQITVEMDEMVRELNRIHEDSKFNTVRLLDGKSLGLNSFGYKDSDKIAGNENTTGLTDKDINLARNVNFNIAVDKADIMNVDKAVKAGATGRNGLVVQSGANTDERMFVQIDAFSTNAIGLTALPNQTYVDAAKLSAGKESTNANQAWRERSFYTPEALNLDDIAYLESAITRPEAVGAAKVNIDMLYPEKADGGKINRVDITTTERATETITVLDVALNKVNKQRADLGAFQNRLEKAVQGVDNASENLQAAESRIRDADMAKEFVEFTKNQILSQSSAGMTAQANMRSQLINRILG
jgi:flagellin